MSQLFFLAQSASSGGGDGLASYTGQIATGSMIPNTLSTTASSSAMTRKGHYNRTTTSTMKLRYPAWYVDIADGANKLGQVVPVGNDLLVDAWVEYPLGVYTQVKFSGGNTGTVPNGLELDSDDVAAPPKDALWNEHIRVRPASGNNYPIFAATTGKPLFTSGGGVEACNRGTSGVPTTPGATTDNQSGLQGYWSCAVLGTTTDHSVAIFGDSISQGVLEQGDASTDLGIIARSVGPNRGYINMGVSSDCVSSLLAVGDRRVVSLGALCSMWVLQSGTNAVLRQSATRGAGANAYSRRFMRKANGKRAAYATLLPKSTSTDSFVTTANQIVVSATNTARELINTDRRSTPEGVRFFETAYPVEDSPGNGKWKVNGSALPNTYVGDTAGTHPSNLGTGLITASGNVNITALKGDSVLALSAYDLTLQTLTGSATYAAGKFNNGVSGAFYNYIDGVFPGNGAFTYECWMSSASIPGAVSYIMSGGPVGVNVQNVSGFVGILTNDGTQTTSTVNVCDGALHHIAVTCTTAGVFNLWVDGTSAATFTIASITRAQWNNEAAAFAIKYRGIASNALAGPFSAAVVDEVAIFNTNKYTAGFTPPSSAYVGNESNLVALWHLDSSLAGVAGPAF